MKLNLSGTRRILVPRTDRQAVITAEDPVAHSGTELQRDLAFMFNRQIGNTATCIQTVRRGKGICRADIKTAGTGPAMIRLPCIRWQYRVGEDHAQKQP